MKAAPFTYHRPDSLADALALLHMHGDEAKVLAGGQSLLPIMAMRIGRPGHLVDISRIPGLDQTELGDDGRLTIGALVRHATVERSSVVASAAPLVHETMPWIAHRAIRTRGTVVGSIAHADPAAELPAVALATGATITAASREGERKIAAADFFQGYLATALRADELATSVTFPAWPSGAVGAVAEVARRHGDYALVGVIVKLELDGSTITDAALAFCGVAPTPIRVGEAEAALVGTQAQPAAIDRAVAAVAAALDPPGDLHATAAYRRHLAGVLTRRGVADALAKIAVLA